MGHQYGELSHHQEVAFRSSSYHLQEGGTRGSSYHLQEGSTMGSSCHLQETGSRGSSFHLQETGSRGSSFHLQETGSRGSSFHLKETGPRGSSYHLHQETGSRRARDWEQETAHSNTVRSRSLRTSSGGAPSSGRWRSRTESEGLTGGRSRDRMSSSTALLHQQSAAQPADSAALSIADFFTDPRH
jgi:hypothetical protein